MIALSEPRVAARPPALEKVPPFPPVAARLMNLVAEEDFSYREVAELIRADASFSAELLRLANSPVFGFRHEIKDVPHAIAVLGLNRLRGIVMTLAMRDFIVDNQHQEGSRRCWRHNLACALACELLARVLWFDSGLAYTAGLLHDVGLLGMVATHGKEYEQITRAGCPEPASILALERDLLGTDHCHAGAWLLTDWDLPPEFAAAAAHHHDPPTPDTPELIRIVQLGCRLAGMAGFSICEETPAWDLEPIAEQLPGKSEGRLRAQAEDFPETVAAKINSFDCDFLN